MKMNELIFGMSLAAFHETVAACVGRGHCIQCDVEGIPDEYTEGGYWRDALSFKEYNISGLCQCCQDDYFKEED